MPTYQATLVDFYVATTDALTGKPVYHLIPKGDDHDLLGTLASVSMTGLSRPVEVDDMQMLDGRASDSILLEAFEKMGYGRNLVPLAPYCAHICVEIGVKRERVGIESAHV